MSNACQLPATEPWMRGTHGEIPAPARAVLHALELTVEDVRRAIADLTPDEFHLRPHGLNPIVFHLRHTARSTDRLLSYAEGRQLTAEQLALLKSEKEIEGSPEELMAEFEAAMQDAASRVTALATTNLEEPRGIGRKQLPTTVGGAMIHVADHAQRHCGQLVTTAQLIRAMRS